MNAPAKKAGPLAYALTSVVIYGLVINCGDKPSLSRISSKCRTESDAIGEVNKAPASSATSKKTSKKAALTSASDADLLQEAPEINDSVDQAAGLALSETSEPSDDGSLGLADDPEAYYDANVKSIMDGKCAGCHGPNRTPPALDIYANVKKQSNDVLRTIRATDSSRMPLAGPLPDSDIAKIAQWVLLLSGSSTGNATSTSTSKNTGSSTGTGSSKNSTTSATATQDECKPVSAPKGTSTATGTGKGTKPKGPTGTSTSGGKK